MYVKNAIPSHTATTMSRDNTLTQIKYCITNKMRSFATNEKSQMQKYVAEKMQLRRHVHNSILADHEFARGHCAQYASYHAVYSVDFDKEAACLL